MDDRPDPEDIPVPGQKREPAAPRERPAPRVQDDSGPDASEAPEEEGSASRP